MDVIALSWIATAYLLAAALFLVPFGKIADISGGKRSSSTVSASLPQLRLP
ncbi:MAG: hypothetical protein WC620_00220 [Methanoregula sp.]